MTQIYSIDVSGDDWSEKTLDEKATIISQWASMTLFNAEGSQCNGNCHGFATIYRKKGRNYIWRANYVPAVVRNRLLSEDIEKTMILYKAGQSGNRREFHNKYPIRLSNNRYSIVTGNPSILYKYAEDNDLLDSDDSHHLHNPAFILWASEHVKDWNALEFASDRSFQKRCWYAWLLESMTLQEYYDYFEMQRELEGNGLRAGYFLWQNGEVMKFWAVGETSIHLNI